MQQGRQADYAIVTLQLATKALAMASDAAPHRARQGEKRWPLANLLPVARVLIDRVSDADRAAVCVCAQSLADTLNDPSGRVTDGFGHTRPIYAWFAVYQLSTAARSIGEQGAVAMMGDAVELLLGRSKATANPGPGLGLDPRLAIWRHLLASIHRIDHDEALPAPANEPTPITPLGRDDLIDAWTYRELVGLHALYLHGLRRSQDGCLQRAEQAALYHLGHTQPDYTTYQPWGLAAFASHPQTVLFAEQQLHDVATHLNIEGPGGAVMPALLLADAAATMAGRLSSAWV